MSTPEEDMVVEALSGYRDRINKLTTVGLGAQKQAIMDDIDDLIATLTAPVERKPLTGAALMERIDRLYPTETDINDD